MLLSGSEILIECLKEQGVDTVFGYPGGQVLNIYDELYKHSHEINHILTSHEQGAAHAADGYARATGKVGVCIATSGPGATNLVTGIATAYMDSVPMVAITGNVPVHLLGKDSFQEVDIAGVTMPITKHNFIVKDINDLAKTMRRAFRIAASGRPGPVLVDITKDVTDPKNKIDYKPVKPDEIERVKVSATDEEIDNVIKTLKHAKKPVVFVGGGAVIAEAHKELKEFVEKLDAPVCDTLMGKGAFDGSDERYTGMLGMHGTKTSNLSVTQCDLLVVVGSRFSDRIVGNPKRFAKNAKIIHLDIDAAEINKNIMAYKSIKGDIKEILKIINSKLEQCHNEEWMEQIMDMKERFPLTYHKEQLTGPYIVEKVYEMTKGDAIITTEVGQHQMWAAQFFKYSKPHQLLTSGGLGTMGYGLGASIGAKIACPDKTVINMAGDGCFRMNMNEIATATRYNVPIIQIVFNNHVLGMVRQWQDLFYGKRYSSTILEDKVDFVKLAEAMGAKAYRVTTKEEFDKVFKEVLALKEPVVLDCQICCDDKVFPMVAPGAAISDIIVEEDLEN
ncbi:MAG: biosynthetic-type acetolactate synthase large subunit [Lachnospiraceae bacterium]|nr:biosynthetic-type acetolactate synthase large subunit [Lachnospiraceae bacterium]